MDRLKLDIENKIWEYFFAKVKGFPFCEMYLSNLYNKQGFSYKNCEVEILLNDKSNPVSLAVQKILTEQDLSFGIKIFQVEYEKSKILMGCVPVEDGNKTEIYIFYDSHLLDILTESEILFGVAHEVGHHVIQQPGSPKDIFNLACLHSLSESHEMEQIKIISNFLSQLSEYNADRYALFITKDISICNSALNKIGEEESKKNPLEQTQEERQTMFREDRLAKLTMRHPVLEDRIKAQEIVANFIGDSNFVLSENPKICKQLKELLCFDEFYLRFCNS